MAFFILSATAWGGWHSDARPKMGTEVSVYFWHDDEARGQAIIEEIFGEVDRINALMSTYVESSRISEINRRAAGEPVFAGEELFEMVEDARLRSIRRREGNEKPGEELVSLVGNLDPGTATQLVRSFATYFQMVNTAEKVHRIRRRREYLRRGIKAQPGGLLAVEAIVIGMATPEMVFHEAEVNFPVIMLLMFMVAGIFFIGGQDTEVHVLFDAPALAPSRMRTRS